MTFLVENSNRCSDICRLCIQNDDTLWNIFETCDSDGISLKLAEKIIACLNIMIEMNDGLPDRICGKCMTIIQCFYDFRQQCKESDSMLRQRCLAPDEHDLSQGKAPFPNSPQHCHTGDCENITERELTSSPCKSETPFHRAESQYEEESNKPATSGSIRKQEDSLLKQLQEEWAEDDSDEMELVHDSTQFELPWRLSEDDSSRDDGKNRSFRGKKTCTNPLGALKSKTHLEKKLLDKCKNPCSDKNDNSEKSCDEHPLLNVPEEEYQSEILNKNISSNSCTVFDKADSDVESVESESCQKEHVTSQFTSKDHNFVKEMEIDPHCEPCSDEEYLNSGSVSKKNNSCGQKRTIVVSKEILAGRINRKENGRWGCGLCNCQGFASIKRLKKHLLNHYTVQNQCHECYANFDSAEELAVHESQHNTSSHILGHSCQHCCKSFRLEHLLKKHIAAEHTSSSGRETVPKKFREKCGHCIRVFYSSVDMENHDESCGENTIQSEEESSEDLPTNRTLSEELPVKHRQHLPPLKWDCLSCKLKFANRRQYTYHVRKVHNTEPISKCEIFGCGKVFKTWQQLLEHRSSVHSMKHACEYCNKLFAEKSKLRIHIRSVHTRECPYKCDKCGKLFPDPRNLLSHKKNHLKNVQCDICRKKFGSKSTMNRHKMAMHIREKRCVCEICGYQSVRRDVLNVHKKRKHGNEEIL